MAVEIGDGRNGDINIHEFDIPRQLAVNFCKEYNLAESTIDLLTSHIVDNIDQLIQEEGRSIKESPEKNNQHNNEQNLVDNNAYNRKDSPQWKVRYNEIDHKLRDMTSGPVE